MKNLKSLVSMAGDRLLAVFVPDAGLAEAASAKVCFTWCWCERYEDGSARKCTTCCSPIPCLTWIECQFCC